MSQPRRYNHQMPVPGRHTAQTSPSHKPVRTWLAAWITRASTGKIKLFTELPEGRVPLEFQAVLQCEHSPVAVGEVTASPDVRDLAWTTADVHRGRAGSKEPRPLHIFGPSKTDIRNDPAVRQRGKWRAAAEMIEAYAAQPPSATEIWLAFELARHGYIRMQELEHVKQAFGNAQISLPLHAVRNGDWLLSNAYLEVQMQALQRKLLRHPTANPFLNRLTAKAVAKLLHLEPASLALPILSHFARSHRLHTEGSGDELVAVLSKDLIPAAAEVTLRTAESIFKLYESEAGMSLEALRQHFASHLNVIQWLLAADLLIENPSGYVFTKRQLLEYQRKMRAAGRNIRNAGVGELKAVLGLKRKPAESLRELVRSELDNVPWTASSAAAGGRK